MYFGLMSVKTELLTKAGSALQSAFSAVGGLLSSVLNALKPLFVAFGAIVAVVIEGVLIFWLFD